MLENIAPEPINGIRGINDDPATEQTVDDCLHIPWLWIRGMQLQKHSEN